MVPPAWIPLYLSLPSAMSYFVVMTKLSSLIWQLSSRLVLIAGISN